MAAELVIARPTSAHVEQLARTMRAADRQEAAALGYASPRAALEFSLEVSAFAAAALFDGEVAALYGVAELPGAPFLSRVGCAWLLTGEAVDRHPLTFWRASKVVVAGLLDVFPRLVADVDARHLSAHSYLRRLGGRLLPAAPLGERGELFHPVVLGAS